VHLEAMSLAFTILAALTVAGALAAMSLRNLVHCVLALALGFAGLAALFLELDAQFVGLSLVIVYIGAVAILTVFAILLTKGADPAWPMLISSWSGNAVVAAAVFSVLAWAIWSSSASRRPLPARPEETVLQIGTALMGRYVLPLELIGLLLTAALIGAVIVAIEERQAPK
jgi:NADH-quinone oxidoreductase subunit J